MKICVSKKGKVTLKDDGKDSFELFAEGDVYFEDNYAHDKTKMMLGAQFSNIHIFVDPKELEE